MEWIGLLVALLVVFGFALAAGYRNKAYLDYVEKRDEVAALRLAGPPASRESQPGR